MREEVGAIATRPRKGRHRWAQGSWGGTAKGGVSGESGAAQMPERRFQIGGETSRERRELRRQEVRGHRGAAAGTEGWRWR
jgi:hypothetical protein